MFLLQLSFAVEVEGFADFILGGGLVDADVADAAQEGEVDGVARVLLVVVHQLDEAGVVVAGDGHAAVVLADEADGLPHLIRGESRLHAAQVQLDDEAPGYSIAVEHGVALQCQRLKGVAGGVAEVQGLADALFRGVFGDDALLDGNAPANGGSELFAIHCNLFPDQLSPVLFAVYESVLEHLGIAGEDVLVVEGAEEGGVEDDAAGIVEDTNLVFQSTEIDARLAAHGGIDHREQGGGYINIRYTALEG